MEMVMMKRKRMEAGLIGIDILWSAHSVSRFLMRMISFRVPVI
jgi:hypothetical protein